MGRLCGRGAAPAVRVDYRRLAEGKMKGLSFLRFAGLRRGRFSAKMAAMMRTRWLVLTILFAGPTELRADGCKFLFNGQSVPEREQRAFIQWERR